MKAQRIGATPSRASSGSARYQSAVGLLQRGVQIFDQARTRGDQDAADGNIAPVIFPGTLQRMDVVQTQLIDAGLQAIQPAGVVVQRVDPR